MKVLRSKYQKEAHSSLNTLNNSTAARHRNPHLGKFIPLKSSKKEANKDTIVSKKSHFHIKRLQSPAFNCCNISILCTTVAILPFPRSHRTSMFSFKYKSSSKPSSNFPSPLSISHQHQNWAIKIAKIDRAHPAIPSYVRLCEKGIQPRYLSPTSATNQILLPETQARLFAYVFNDKRKRKETVNVDAVRPAWYYDMYECKFIPLRYASFGIGS